jgi:hypothetical protein
MVPVGDVRCGTQIGCGVGEAHLEQDARPVIHVVLARPWNIVGFREGNGCQLGEVAVVGAFGVGVEEGVDDGAVPVCGVGVFEEIVRVVVLCCRGEGEDTGLAGFAEPMWSRIVEGGVRGGLGAVAGRSQRAVAVLGEDVLVPTADLGWRPQRW